MIEISGPSITTRQVRDVILPNDPSQPTTFSSISTPGNISGFTLSLAGNLTVAGSAAVHWIADRWRRAGSQHGSSEHMELVANF